LDGFRDNNLNIQSPQYIGKRTHVFEKPDFYVTTITDGFVKSPAFMSFRAKREILWEQAIEKIGFLPKVEMTDAKLPTFYEIIITDHRFIG
jgi:hypothetical protein